MSLFHLLILALIQGITEFLPISSSGHLILLPQLTGMEDQGIVLDVAVHVGTLVAVMWFWRADVLQMIRALPDAIRLRFDSPGARNVMLLAVATVPVMAVGFILKETGWIDGLRSVTVIGWTMLLFGIVLYAADKLAPNTRAAESWKLKDAVILGLWQAVALIPGTSRSGITVTAARMQGFERHDAAKLSMLMSIPTIIASGILTAKDMIGVANAQLIVDGAVAAAMALVAALVSLSLMMRFINAVSFTPYVIYRVILGVGLLVYAYS